MTNGNEPAFAKPAQFDAHTNVLREESRGLTKREYFAAMAMQGILQNFTVEQREGLWAAIAKDSVDAADELIIALNTNKQQDNG